MLLMMVVGCVVDNGGGRLCCQQWWGGWVWMVVVLGFGFVDGGEREREKLTSERDGFGIYILLHKYIILMCYIEKQK